MRKLARLPCRELSFSHSATDTITTLALPFWMVCVFLGEITIRKMGPGGRDRPLIGRSGLVHGTCTRK